MSRLAASLGILTSDSLIQPQPEAAKHRCDILCYSSDILMYMLSLVYSSQWFLVFIPSLTSPYLTQ